MASIECYLKELDKQRDLLANILTEKGIESDESETYNSLVAKVEQLKVSGGVSAMPAYIAATGTTGITGNAIEIPPEDLMTYYTRRVSSTSITINDVRVVGNPDEQALLVVIASHYATATIQNDGFEKVVEGVSCRKGSQKLTVWKKAVGTGTYSITASSSASNTYFSIEAIVLYGAKNVTVVDNVLFSASSGTPTAPSGKRRLYAFNSWYGSDDNSPIYPTNNAGLDLIEIPGKWQCSYYDYQPSLAITPTFNSREFSAIDWTMLTLDIEEE